MRFIIAIVRPIVWLLCRACFRIRFHGVENVPAEGACIITPNHVTYADPIWISIPIRRRVYFMAWDRPFEIPVLGFLMRTFGAFPVRLETADPRAQRRAREAIESGRALVIFPEGGRTITGELMPFKMGAFRLAVTYGVPVVPVTIDGAYLVWPVGRILPRPGRITITYHPPIPVERLDENAGRQVLRERAHELAMRTRAAVARALPAESAPNEGESSEAFST